MLVHNKGKYVRHAAGVTLVPGANDVDEQDFKDFSGHPIMKKVVESGEIEALKKVGDNDGSGGAETTKDLNASDAIEMVKDTYDPSLLEKWKEDDDRKTVQDAIDKQLEDIRGEGEGNQGDA